MKINYNKILYLSTHSIDVDPGVEKKIHGICAAAEKKGFAIERQTMYCRSIGERRNLVNRAFDSDAGIIFIRSFGVMTISIISALKKLRKEGRIIICDQPSPLSTTLREIWHSNRKLIKRLYSISWGILSGPWSMYPYNRIIEYAPEGRYYSLGNRRRIKLMGNGIDISRINPRKYLGRSDSNIRLVGVANTSVHHGYDRVIRALADFNRNNKRKAYFEIIGGSTGSPVINELKALSKDLNVEKYITFAGFQDKDYISEAYNTSDLAIGSLGLFRIGLGFSSILKVREYCLAGIPFITAGEDPDFEENPPFRFVVPNDESIAPILNVLNEFSEKRKTFTDEQIREYALEHFSFDKKFDQMMEGLL